MDIVKKLSDNTKQYIENYFYIVDEMASKMKNVQPTDSISQTFIEQMIPHHEGAIGLSENILSYTTDTEIEQLAKQIIAYQSNHIQLMREMYDNCKEVKNSERDVSLYQREFLNIFNRMIDRMNHALDTNNLNLNFLTGMIPHHEGGIEMAQNVLKYEICERLREMAENLITTQINQLSQMKNILRKYQK